MSLLRWVARYDGVEYACRDGLVTPMELRALVDEWDGRDYRTSYGATLHVNADEPDPETVYVLCEELLWTNLSTPEILEWDYPPPPKNTDLVF